LVRREPEVAPGFPDRILPVDESAAAILKKRTLTNLYNERPAGSITPTATSTPRSPPPTAGRPTSPTTRRCADCSS
jgi:hypothetical protein